MRVYLDNCCYNRPFDEQKQLCVRLETVTKLASAEKANCDMFLTTDKGILKKVPMLGRMKVVNPIQFISEEYNENL